MACNAGALDEVDWLKTRLEDLETAILSHSGGSDRASPSQIPAVPTISEETSPANSELLAAAAAKATVTQEQVSPEGQSSALENGEEDDGGMNNSAGRDSSQEENAPAVLSEGVEQERGSQEILIGSTVSDKGEWAADAEAEQEASGSDDGSYSGSDGESEEDSDA